jgi:hypothetical protein
MDEKHTKSGKLPAQHHTIFQSLAQVLTNIKPDHFLNPLANAFL